jgi:hypothetical protein
MFTMNLSWGAQFTKAHKDLKDALHHLNTSCAIAGQRLRIINSSIRAKQKYGFYAAPYTRQQLAKLDSLLTCAYKKAYWLPVGASAAMDHEDVNKGGLGCTSAMAEYATVQTQRLTQALNDRGILGRLTQASLRLHTGWLDKLAADMYLALMRYSLRTRQLAAAAASAGIHMRHVEGQLEHCLPEANNMHKQLSQLVAMAEQDDQNVHPVLAADVAALRAMGLDTMQDIMDPRSWKVLTHRQVEMRTGQAMTVLQTRALQRVTRLLRAPPQTGVCRHYTDSTTQAHEGAVVHITHRAHIRSLGLCAAANLMQTPLAALWEVQRCPLPREGVVQEIQSLTSALLKPRRPKKADTRKIEPGVTTQLGRRNETGYTAFIDRRCQGTSHGPA